MDDSYRFWYSNCGENGESIGGYNSLIALNPAKERGLVMIASTDVLDLEIAYYQYGAYDELSTLIWDFLTN